MQLRDAEANEDAAGGCVVKSLAGSDCPQSLAGNDSQLADVLSRAMFACCLMRHGPVASDALIN